MDATLHHVLAASGTPGKSPAASAAYAGSFLGSDIGATGAEMLAAIGGTAALQRLQQALRLAVTPDTLAHKAGHQSAASSDHVLLARVAAMSCIVDRAYTPVHAAQLVL